MICSQVGEKMSQNFKSFVGTDEICGRDLCFISQGV
jgi:hypothetical protein